MKPSREGMVSQQGSREGDQQGLLDLENFCCGLGLREGRQYHKWRGYVVCKNEHDMNRIASVTYHLHSSYPDPDRTTVTAGLDPAKAFPMPESFGWCTFPLRATVKLTDGREIELEKRLVFTDKPCPEEKPVKKGKPGKGDLCDKEEAPAPAFRTLAVVGR